MNSLNYILIFICLLPFTQLSQSTKILQLEAGETSCRSLPPGDNLHLSVQVLAGNQAEIYFTDSDHQVGLLKTSVYEEDFYLPPGSSNVKLCIHNFSNQTSIEFEQTITSYALNKTILNFGLICSVLLLILLILLILISCGLCLYLIYRNKLATQAPTQIPE